MDCDPPTYAFPMAVITAVLWFQLQQTLGDPWGLWLQGAAIEEKPHTAVLRVLGAFFPLQAPFSGVFH
jgi:hypothetical protein